MMQQTHDIDRFPYRDFNGKACFCRLRIWEEEGQPPVIVATEVEENSGMSVTNAAELITSEAWRFLERPQTFVFIEHYPERDDKTLPRWEESFDLVLFQRTEQGFRFPHWQPLQREEVEALIGGPIAV